MALFTLQYSQKPAHFFDLRFTSEGMPVDPTQFKLAVRTRAESKSRTNASWAKGG